MSLMTAMVIVVFGDAGGCAGCSGKAKAFQDGEVLAMGGVVSAVWIDAELKQSDAGEIDGVVFDFFGGASGREGELLPNDFAYGPIPSGSVNGKFL